MRYFLKHITSFSWFVGILLSMGALCMWIPDFFSDSILWIPTLSLTIWNAVLLMYLLYKTGVTRTRTSLPIFVYPLVVGVIPALHTQWEGQLSVTVLQFILILLYNAFRNPMAVHESFVSTLLLALASLAQPDIVILLPIVWIGFAIQRSFSLRVLLASLIAAAVFAIYLFIFIWFVPDVFAVVSPSEAFARTIIKRDVWLVLTYLCVFAVVFVVMSFIGYTRENTHAQSLVLMLTMILVSGLVLMIFPPVLFSSLMPIAAFAVAGLAAYVFSSQRSESVATGIIFLLFLILSVTTYTLPKLI